MIDILALAIMNAAPIICWTVIVVHFDRWYLALFALLFGFSYKRYRSEQEDD